MLQTAVITGALLLGFIAADWLTLNGFGYIIAIIYMIAFTPLIIKEIVKLVRK